MNVILPFRTVRHYRGMPRLLSAPGPSPSILPPSPTYRRNHSEYAGPADLLVRTSVHILQNICGKWNITWVKKHAETMYITFPYTCNLQKNFNTLHRYGFCMLFFAKNECIFKSHVPRTFWNLCVDRIAELPETALPVTKQLTPFFPAWGKSWKLQLHRNHSACSSSWGEGSDSLNTFGQTFCLPSSYKSSTPELVVGIECFKFLSAKYSLLRRSRTEFVYTHWAMCLKKKKLSLRCAGNTRNCKTTTPTTLCHQDIINAYKAARIAETILPSSI